MSEKLSIGEHVVMHTCGEATLPKNDGVLFVVASEPRDLCGTEVVTLNFKDSDERIYMAFATEFLQRVKQ